MKNIVIALSIFFALGSSAHAQKAKTNTTNTKPSTTTTKAPYNIEASAQKNLTDLMAVATDLDGTKQQALKELFISKHSMLSEDLSDERKRAVSQSVEYRLGLLLDPATLAKIKANQKLYSSLIN